MLTKSLNEAKLQSARDLEQILESDKLANRQKLKLLKMKKKKDN